jgi:hypothetical protein
MEEGAFWEEAIRRRNLFFVWLLGWIPVGVPFVAGWRFITGREPSSPVVGLLLAWFVPCLLIWLWLSRLPCPQCGRPALPSPFFLLRRAKCQHCGFTYGI